MDESALYMTGKGHRKSEDNVNPLFGVKFSRNYFPISYLKLQDTNHQTLTIISDNFYKLLTGHIRGEQILQSRLTKIANRVQVI